MRLAVAGAAVVTSLTAATAAAAPTPMRPPGDSLALGPMGSNDLELGSRRTARRPADPAGAFIYRRGRYTPLDALDGRLTAHIGLNNRGQIVGASSTGPGQQSHGFLLRDGANGPFTPIDVPGAPGTGATGINDAGTIVGNYTNPMARPARNQPTPMGRMA